MSASDVPSRAPFSSAETARMARVAGAPGAAPVTEQSSRPVQAVGSAPSPSGSGPGSSGAAPAPARSGSSAVKKSPSSARRRARLVLTRVDPWSVMKLSFLLAIALGIVTLVAVAVLWNVLDAMGVFTSVSSTYQELTTSEQGAGTDLMQYLGFERVMGAAGTLAAVNVVLITALATLSAFLYNITTALVGGLHVTLTDDAY